MASLTFTLAFSILLLFSTLSQLHPFAAAAAPPPHRPLHLTRCNDPPHHCNKLLHPAPSRHGRFFKSSKRASKTRKAVHPHAASESLSNDHYMNSCPQLEAIIQKKVIEWLKIDLSLAASLLRLHFHDCMVTGCDASILLADPKTKSTEMYSVFSKGLRGFEVVDDIKLAVEKECPGTVSCADVLATIARDVVLETGGPFWFVPFGRKDSLTSHIEDAAKVPHQDSNATTLTQQFAALGLSPVDLSALSGAHTIGRCHCFSFNGADRSGANPRMNASYAHYLKADCKKGPWTTVYNDPITPFVFDLQYYINLRNNMGLFKSDQSLYYDNDMTSSMIQAFLTQPGIWESQFAVGMVNMGNVQVKTGRQGEIRRVCSQRNPSRRH